MTKKKRRESSFTKAGKKKRKSKFRRMIETLAGIFIGLGLVIGLIIWFNMEPAEADLGEASEGRTEYEDILQNGNGQELYSKLLELNEWPRDGVLAVKMEWQDKRLAIADKLMGNDDSEERHRVAAALATLDAMSIKYGLDFSEKLGDQQIVERYLAAADKFASDPNADVQREAYLAKAKALVFESDKSDWNGSFDIVEKSILDLVSKYPNDDYVMGTIKLLAQRLMKVNGVEGIKLITKIIDTYPSDVDERTKENIQEIVDFRTIHESGVRELLETIDPRKQRDHERLHEKALALTKRNDIGKSAVDLIKNMITFFERYDNHEMALDVSRSLLENSENLEFKASRAARIQAENAIKRNSLIGKHWNFEAVDENGVEINSESYADKACVIMFWSPQDRSQTNVFTELNRIYNSLLGKNAKVFTVAIQPASEFEIQSRSNPQWTNLISRPDKMSPYLLQCPVIRVPYMILVGRDGKVKSINVDMVSLKTKMDKLLTDAASN